MNEALQWLIAIVLAFAIASLLLAVITLFLVWLFFVLPSSVRCAKQAIHHPEWFKKPSGKTRFDTRPMTAFERVLCVVFTPMNFKPAIARISQA